MSKYMVVPFNYGFTVIVKRVHEFSVNNLWNCVFFFFFFVWWYFLLSDQVLCFWSSLNVVVVRNQFLSWGAMFYPPLPIWFLLAWAHQISRIEFYSDTYSSKCNTCVFECNTYSFEECWKEISSFESYIMQ